VGGDADRPDARHLARVTESPLSSTAVDRLGDRLRGDLTDADLRMLADYRGSFREAFDTVIEVVARVVTKRVTGRPAKSNASVIAKLRRESSLRLSQMQDIAGCRAVLPDDRSVDAARDALLATGFRSRAVDRRVTPQYGYRGLHLIVTVGDRDVEVQLRSGLQHLWAELCERYADEFGSDVKYGGGPPWLRDGLKELSSAWAAVEDRIAHDRQAGAAPRIAERIQLVRPAVELMDRLAADAARARGE
jgi:ppGpp synthetase/RelA/SpoT-type nucleotidyltranferase